MRELAKLRALTGAERRLLAFCLVATPFVASGLAILGYRRMHAALSRWPRTRPLTERYVPQQAELARAKSVARIVAVAAGSGPVRTTCLRRSLLLWWLLRHDGIETVVRVGVRRGERGALDAHAWVEHLGRPLNDGDDVAQRFVPFAWDFGVPPERLS